MSRLDEIKERCEKATPGKWLAQAGEPTCDGWPIGFTTGSSCIDNQSYSIHSVGNRASDLLLSNSDNDAKSDCEFIAHSRSDVPYLLEVIDKIKAAYVHELRDYGYLKADAEKRIRDVVEALKISEK